MSTRVHARDLPSSEEIKQMMESEADREPITTRVFADFAVVKKWLEQIGVETNIFEMLTIDEVNDEVTKIKPWVVSKTLKKPPECVAEIENYLGQEDNLEKADIGFVFGGRTLNRAEKGAELYLQGWVKKLLMSGKSPNYTAFFDAPEAEVFAKRAVEMGVPQEDILIESNSINIASNVRGGLNLLDERGVRYSSMMQIISWYANRRAWCVLKKYLSSEIKLIRVNAPLPSDSLYHLGEWYKTEEGIEIIFNEFIKMKHQSLTGRA